MVDPKNRALRPPIQRSWLRLRLGKAYYAAQRYALWCSPRYRWAREQQQDSLPYLQASHETPLLRQLRGEDMELQRNKVVNLRLAVEKLDGVLLRPGETLSYWRLIGKPSARRGYLPGMVLFLGCIGSDVGGGLCQLSNLIFWMTLTRTSRWWSATATPTMSSRTPSAPSPSAPGPPAPTPTGT